MSRLRVTAKQTPRARRKLRKHQDSDKSEKGQRQQGPVGGTAADMWACVPRCSFLRLFLCLVLVSALTLFLVVQMTHRHIPIPDSKERAILQQDDAENMGSTPHISDPNLFSVAHGRNQVGSTSSAKNSIPAYNPVLISRRPPRRSLAKPDHGGGWVVLDTYKHDRNAFTQGFELLPEDREEGEGGMGTMYEGTGLYGSSELRRVDIATGKVLARVKLGKKFFGEGITLWGESIIQLTWKEKTGFIFDRQTLKETGRFSYNTHTGQGWGLANDGERLIVTDGSHFLHFWDPEKPGREVRKRIIVRDPNNRISSTTSDKNRRQGPALKKGPNGEVGLLNEIAWFRGTVLANIWYNDHVIQIDPDTGIVLAAWDFTDLQLRPLEWHPRQDCLNGIAVLDENSGELLLTGKKWRRSYRVRIEGLQSKGLQD